MCLRASLGDAVLKLRHTIERHEVEIAKLRRQLSRAAKARDRYRRMVEDLKTSGGVDALNGSTTCRRSVHASEPDGGKSE